MEEEIMEEPIPVYLITGFLDSGKTTFINDTLSDERFSGESKTLLIMCEEGDVELSDNLSERNVVLRTIEDEEEMTEELLAAWQEEIQPEQVMIEYNGMWTLDTLYGSMPPSWMVYQEFMFAEAGSFISYNSNMRQLVYDKLKSCDLIVFNRMEKSDDFMPLHKIVRAANRNAEIGYEDINGKVFYDSVEDPLPFDKDSRKPVIADRDYAIWYRDLGEDLKTYDGMTVTFKAQAAFSDELPRGCFIVGRDLMNCCAADTAFAGLICEGGLPKNVESGDWVSVKAKIVVKEHPGYNREGPVLTKVKVSPAEAPDDPVATFY
ncbi:MAG: GTPase [Oscillospiraceae bacterium]|nr:GTPase [Oscillospiraceae bacterium]